MVEYLERSPTYESGYGNHLLRHDLRAKRVGDEGEEGELCSRGSRHGSGGRSHIDDPSELEQNVFFVSS